jgi:hypothetical protein
MAAETHNILVRDFTKAELAAVDGAWKGKHKSRQVWCKKVLLEQASKGRNGKRAAKH